MAEGLGAGTVYDRISERGVQDRSPCSSSRPESCGTAGIGNQARLGTMQRQVEITGDNAGDEVIVSEAMQGITVSQVIKNRWIENRLRFEISQAMSRVRGNYETIMGTEEDAEAVSTYRTQLYGSSCDQLRKAYEEDFESKRTEGTFGEFVDKAMVYGIRDKVQSEDPELCKRIIDQYKKSEINADRLTELMFADAQSGRINAPLIVEADSESVYAAVLRTWKSEQREDRICSIVCAVSRVVKKVLSDMFQDLKDAADIYRFRDSTMASNYIRVKLFDKRVGVKFMNVGQGTSSMITDRKAQGRKVRLLNDLGPNEINILRTIRRKKGRVFSFIRWTPAVDNYLNTEEKTEEEKLNTELEQVWKDVADCVYLLITHSHDDHMGGKEIGELKDLFGDRIVAIGQTDFDRTFPDAWTGFYTASQYIDIQGAVPTSRKSDENNDSLISYKVAGSTLFLFPGDRRAGDIHTFLKMHHMKKVVSRRHVIMAASHHGSSTGIDGQLVDYMRELGALDVTFVISAGIGNIHGHPTHEFMDASVGKGANVYNTQELEDQQGAVGAIAAAKEPVPPSIYVKIHAGAGKICHLEPHVNHNAPYTREKRTISERWGRGNRLAYRDILLRNAFREGAPEGPDFTDDFIESRVTPGLDSRLGLFVPEEKLQCVKEKIVDAVIRFYQEYYSSEKPDDRQIDTIADRLGRRYMR